MFNQRSYGEPRIPKYPNTLFQRTLNLLSFLAVAFTFFYPLLKWNQIPDTIITHWGFSGQPDSWGSKYMLWIQPLICLILYLPLTILESFPSVWNVPVKITERNQKWVYQNIKTMLILMKFLMTAMFSYILYCSVQGKDLGTLSLFVFLILLFGSMLFFIIRSTRKPKEKGTL